jgi:hypothetical protein
VTNVLLIATQSFPYMIFSRSQVRHRWEAEIKTHSIKITINITFRK